MWANKVLISFMLVHCFSSLWLVINYLLLILIKNISWKTLIIQLKQAMNKITYIIK